MNEPLASRIRPKSIDEFIGQDHLLGEDAPLRNAIQKKQRFSFILWGPPGSGKTTLARIYAGALGADLYELSAVSAGKADIRKILSVPSLNKPKILFLDEIHRFNKAQQDFLLPFVESGELTLIGATTENPSFEVISALLSRLRVFTLKSHDETALREILSRSDIAIDDEAKDMLVRIADGDARKALTTLENVNDLYGEVTLANTKEFFDDDALRYDKAGDEHYNTISAFIKSMRASQPDAALYYLARMVKAGEDPKFIARRMVIFASEDIGLAQPTALVVANGVFRACETIGYPECAINLAHGVAYLAQCKKSRASYDAYNQAVSDVKTLGNLPIPKKIRNAPTKLMKNEGYGKGYEKYDDESFLPEKLRDKKYLK